MVYAGDALHGLNDCVHCRAVQGTEVLKTVMPARSSATLCWPAPRP